MIDYILKTTGNQQLTYIGHSMGCGVLLLGAAINAVINSKIKLMIALAPGVYGGHITNMYFRPLIPLGNFIVSDLLMNARNGNTH
jgi:pimeloyl-ACP methyl ester carboxylesterase